MKIINFSVVFIVCVVMIGLLFFVFVVGFVQEIFSDVEIEKIEVKGLLGSLFGQDVEVVFGFGKFILEMFCLVLIISDE